MTYRLTQSEGQHAETLLCAVTFFINSLRATFSLFIFAHKLPVQLMNETTTFENN